MTAPNLNSVTYLPLAPEHFDDVIRLGNEVQGENYLMPDTLKTMYDKSWHNNINASLVSYCGDDIVGFRITYAHSQWQCDKWCSPELWPVAPDKVCYFKCNTVSPAMQGAGIGSTLLAKSVSAAKAQGAEAGLAHIWLSSPGNSAFKYFSKNGGELIKKHPNKWRYESIHEGYDCPVCPETCECEGAEMLLRFS